MTTLGDRLRSERRRFKLSQTDFASIGGVGKNQQFRYEHNKGVPDAHYLINLSNYGVNINWILFGNLNNEGSEARHPISLDVNDDLIGIPLYTIEENNPPKESELVHLPKSWFIKNNLPTTDIVIVINQGDAMSPNIKDNDWVLADTKKKYVGNGGAIAFRLGHRILVNNLQPQGEELLVSGFNRTFPSYTLNLSTLLIDFEIIGRVITSLNQW